LGILVDAHFCGRLLIIPDNVNFSDDWTFHFSVVLEIAFEHGVVAPSTISHRHNSKPELINKDVSGVGGFAALLYCAINARVIKKMSYRILVIFKIIDKNDNL
jgi:hypothetical protein